MFAPLKQILPLAGFFRDGFALAMLVLMTAYRMHHARHSPGTGRSSILKADSLLAGMGLALCAVFFAALFSYLIFPSYLDHVEPLVAAIAAQSLHGQPAHPIWSRGEGIYGLPYGPVLFQINALALAFVPTIMGSKLLGALMPFLTILFQYLSIRPVEADKAIRLRLTILSLIVFSTSYYCFVDRGDSFLLMLSALGLLALQRMRPVPAAIVIGLAAGIALGIKPHAIFYFAAPALALISRQDPAMPRTGCAVLGAASAAVAAVLPFAFPGASISGYAAYLVIATRHGLDAALFAQNILLALALAAIPAAAYFVQRPKLDRQTRVFLLSAAAAAIVVAIIAAKPGAGPHHLLPFVPAAISALARILAAPGQRPISRRQTLNAIFLSALVTFGVVGFLSNAYVINIAVTGAAAERLKLEELLQLRQRFAGAEMGVSDFEHYPDTYLYPALIFQGGKLEMVAATWMDFQLSGVDERYALDLLTHCAVAAWIVPSQGAPFSTLSIYTLNPLFSRAFQETFRRNYRRSAHGRYFDVWQCRAAGG